MVKEDYITFVSKLNRMTQEGAIQWKPSNPPKFIKVGSDSEVPVFFHAELEGRQLALYEERYRNYDPDSDNFYWDSRFILCIFDKNWALAWEFPSDLSGLAELIDAAKRQVCGVDEFLGKFLNDKRQRE